MFVAPVIVILLMLATMVAFHETLRQQQSAFLEVVHGPLARATTTTTALLLDVSEVQADVLRYTRLWHQLSSDDRVLEDLRRTIRDRFDRIEATFTILKAEAAGPAEADVIENIEHFLAIHKAVSLRIIDAPIVDTVSVSTIMAHYHQLQIYISEFAERSLASAQETANQTERDVSSLLLYLLIGSAVIILFSIVITFSIGRAISRPLIEMIGILTSIADGKLATTVPGQQRRDEIGAMARAVAVFDTVTRELRVRERSLEEARRHAESANAAKSAFLANVSHELRTPLTSILGFTRVIQRRFERTIAPRIPPDDPALSQATRQMAENIDIILTEGARLTTLINNLLDLEKIEAGEMTWQVEPIEIEDAITQAKAATASLYEAKGLRFKVEIAPGLPSVMADKDRVIQVLINLISNAVKFTAEGDIRCTATMRDDRFVEIGIIDTGEGISPIDQETIFERFRQVGDTLTDKPTGTGLGLAICREIIQHLGGNIRVESQVGRGSTFSFTLPVATPEQAMPRAVHGS